MMATYQLPVPDPMQCTGDVATNWKSFKEMYTNYVTMTELHKKEKVNQVITLKQGVQSDTSKIRAKRRQSYIRMCI